MALSIIFSPFVEIFSIPFISLITSSFVVLEASPDNSNCGSFLLCLSVFIHVTWLLIYMCVCMYVYLHQTLILKNVCRHNVKPTMLIFFSREDFFFASARCLRHYYSGILTCYFQRLRCFESAWFPCEILCTSRSLPFLGCSPSGSQTTRGNY